MAMGILIVWQACIKSPEVKLVIEIIDIPIAVVQFIIVRFKLFFTDTAVDPS